MSGCPKCDSHDWDAWKKRYTRVLLCETCGYTEEKIEHCWSCWEFIDTDAQTEDGIHCRNCGNETPATELRTDGYEYTGTRWVKTEDPPDGRLESLGLSGVTTDDGE